MEDTEIKVQCPKAASALFPEDNTLRVLHFHPAEGFKEKTISGSSLETLHEYFLNEGYWLNEDATLPLGGEGSSVECVEYHHQDGSAAFVRDSSPIFVDNYADLFALKVQLAPWLLLTLMSQAICDVRQEVFNLQSGRRSVLDWFTK